MPDPDTSIPPPSTTQPSGAPQHNRHQPRKNRNRPPSVNQSKPPLGASASDTPANISSQEQSDPVNDSGHKKQATRQRRDRNSANPRRPKAPQTAIDPSAPQGNSTLTERADSTPTHRPNRRTFGSRLTTDHQHSVAHGKPARGTETLPPSGEAVPSKDASLTSRLIAAFSRTAEPSDAVDCPICFNTIGSGQPTWSCSQNSIDGIAHGTNCWTTFHLKCIRSWASKSTKETREAYLARNLDQPGEWRCPGCQTKRYVVPSDYYCFCGRTANPKPGRLSTPHSCGESCSRKRLQCDHPCPLSCHPGPCPPCLSSVTQRCHCGKKVMSLRCALLGVPSNPQSKPAPLSCEQLCNRKLDCGKHLCQKSCHPGACDRCEELIDAKCYCSAQTRSMRCGDGHAQTCIIEGNEARSWEGYFQCGGVCNRPFNCRKHACQKGCHPPTPIPPECPFSPSSIKSCPCSHQIPLSSLSAVARVSCTDPIPTCGQVCGKPIQTCEHLCTQVCHEGPCKRCELVVEERCRCGRTGRKRACWEVSSPNPETSVSMVFTCDKKCPALQSCGKHVCGKICCPLSILGIPETNKGKRKAKDFSALVEDGRLIDPEGWHTCNLICNKPLTCGSHYCTANDHRGVCPPCLQSSFEELVCFCGRTVLDPPIPCGTIIRCTYPCSRQPLPCGHPKVPHSCHEFEGGCPPCPFLTTKLCACGKVMVQNIRCSQEKVSCGLACGKPLDCGFHSCDRLCHTGDCGSCSQTCGKSRKYCLPLDHPCPFPCHAPATCPETEPCHALVTLNCPCGRLSQEVPCGASSLAPARKARQLTCLQECEVAKRNARLAEALGISPERASQSAGASVNQLLYPESMQAFLRANVSFVAGLEKTFSEFVASDKRMMVLNPMPPQRRKFVRELANIYRMDTNEVDQEPRRSIQLVRRIDTRLPPTLLSSLPTISKRVVFSSQKPAATLAPATHNPAVPIKTAWNSKAAPGYPRPDGPSAWKNSDPNIMSSTNRLPAVDDGSSSTKPLSKTELSVVPDEWDQDDC